MVVTQDLLPRLCAGCSRETTITDSQKAFFEKHGVKPPDRLHVADGCEACHGYGHAGRVGVFEVVEIDTDMGYALGAGLSQRELTDMFRRQAGHSLVADALTKAATGTVSFEAVKRLAANTG
jgi:general secretion pathway protein E